MRPAGRWVGEMSSQQLINAFALFIYCEHLLSCLLIKVLQWKYIQDVMTYYTKFPFLFSTRIIQCDRLGECVLLKCVM